MSIRSIVRMTGASKNTVAKLLVDAGLACSDYQDRAFRELPCKKLQLDEIWSFVGAKEKNVPAERKGLGIGDVWTWTAICADTKLVPSWFVGGRDSEHALAFGIDLGLRRFTRLTNAFSKKMENHCHALSIYLMHYNFARIHQSTRVTPAMAAGVSDKLWDMTDIVRMIEAYESGKAMETEKKFGGKLSVGPISKTAHTYE